MNYKMKKIRIILLIILWSKLTLCVAQTTLQSCIVLAEKNSPNTKLLFLVKEAETVQLDILNKNLMPQTSLNSQATWQSEVTGLNIPIPNFEFTKIPKDQYKTTLDISQIVWDGGLNKSQKALVIASSKTDSRGIENTIYQLKEQISTLYFGILLANKQMVNTEITKNDLENQFKKQNANLQNGTVIKSNVILIEARLIELKQGQREIRSRKLAALKGLSILTGQDFQEDSVLEEPQAGNLENTTIDRPELKFYDAQKELTEANKVLTKTKYAPKINLFATGGYSRPGLNFLSPDFSGYFIGGISLKIPLSHLYLNTKSADSRQWDINNQRISKQKEAFLQQIDLKLSVFREDLSKLQDQINEDAKLIEIRSYIKKVAEKSLENGVITLSDYMTKVDDETTAKQNLSLHQVQLLQVNNNIGITKGKF